MPTDPFRRNEFEKKQILEEALAEFRDLGDDEPSKKMMKTMLRKLDHLIDATKLRKINGLSNNEIVLHHYQQFMLGYVKQRLEIDSTFQMRALEDKFAFLVSLDEIQKLKSMIDSMDYSGKNQVLMEMIASNKDKLFMKQIHQAKPEVRNQINMLMKSSVAKK